MCPSNLLLCPHTVQTRTNTYRSSGVNPLPPVSDYSNWPVRLRKCVTAESGVENLPLMRNEWKTKGAPKWEKSYWHFGVRACSLCAVYVCMSGLVCLTLWIIYSHSLTHTYFAGPPKSDTQGHSERYEAGQMKHRGSETRNHTEVDSINHTPRVGIIAFLTQWFPFSTMKTTSLCCTELQWAGKKEYIRKHAWKVMEVVVKWVRKISWPRSCSERGRGLCSWGKIAPTSVQLEGCHPIFLPYRRLRGLMTLVLTQTQTPLATRSGSPVDCIHCSVWGEWIQCPIRYESKLKYASKT